MNFLDYRKTYSRDSESTKGQVGFGRVRFFSVSNFFLHLFFNLFFKLGFREQEKGKKKKKYLQQCQGGSYKSFSVRTCGSQDNRKGPSCSVHYQVDKPAAEMPSFLPIVVSRAECSLPMSCTQVDTAFYCGLKSHFPFHHNFSEKLFPQKLPPVTSSC